MRRSKDASARTETDGNAALRVAREKDRAGKSGTGKTGASIGSDTRAFGHDPEERALGSVGGNAGRATRKLRRVGVAGTVR